MAWEGGRIGEGESCGRERGDVSDANCNLPQRTFSHKWLHHTRYHGGGGGGGTSALVRLPVVC